MKKEDQTAKLKKKNFFVRSLFWLNMISALFLGLSYVSPFISPQDFWPFAFIGLAYYYLLLVNLGFMLLWLFLRRRNALVSLITILLGWNHLGHLVRLNFNSSPAETGTIKVLSWNVRLFDLYNWSKNKQTRNKIFAFLKNEKADILCLQEFYESPEHFPVLDTLRSLQQAGHVHTAYTLEKQGQYFGIATFSVYPIVNKGFIDFNERTNNSCIYTDILKEKDTIRIYNLHLQSNTLNQEDIDFLEHLGKDEVNEIEGSGKIFEKLKQGFIKRAAQAEIVADHISRSPYPVIVCGDMNDSPFSYTYSTVSSGLTDCFESCGSGVGRTYNGKFPSFRIDYILHSEKFEAVEFQTIPVDLSDHYPVTCKVKQVKE